MRKFTIDFTSENRQPDGSVLGKQGEHNATELVIIPPSEMTDCENVTSYRIAFGLTNCRCVHSETLEKTVEVSMLLFSQITSSDTVEIQLEGYGTDGNLVMKSETVKKLKFLPSVCGKETDSDSNSQSMSNEVNQNTLARHTHDNKDVLDGLSADGKNLMFNGQNIGGGSVDIELLRAQIVASLFGRADVTIITENPNECLNNELYTSWQYSVGNHAYLLFVPTCDGQLSYIDLDTYEITKTIGIIKGQICVLFSTIDGELFVKKIAGDDLRALLINGLESIDFNS